MKTLALFLIFALFAVQTAFPQNLDQDIPFGFSEESDVLTEPFRSYSLRSDLKRAVDTSLVAEEFNLTGLGTPYSGRVFRDLASAYTGQIQDGLVNLRAQDEEETSILSSNTLGNFTDSDFNITESFESTPGYVNIPVGVGAIVMVYNLDVSRTLILSGDVLAKMYLSQILFWNDTEIQELNPGLDLPPAPIVKIYDDSPSGLTLSFTTALSAMSPIWAHLIGPTNQFPQVLTQNNPTYFGTDQISTVSFLRGLRFSITYLSYAYYKLQSTILKFSYMQNKAGNIVNVTPFSIASAIVPALPGQPLDLMNSAHPAAWPMVTTSYLQFPIPEAQNVTGCSNAYHILVFTDWILTSYLGTLLSNRNGFLVPVVPDIFQDAVNQMEVACSSLVPVEVDAKADIVFSSLSTVTTDWISPYSPTPDQVWSSWFGELGSPVSASQAPSYHFSPVQTTQYIDEDGFLVPTNDISPGFEFSSNMLEKFSTKVNSAHRSLNPLSSLLLCVSLVAGSMLTLTDRKARQLALVFLLSLALSSSFFVQGFTRQKIFVIGGLFPLTGPNATAGAEQESASRLAMDSMNQSPVSIGNLTAFRLLTLNTRSTENGAVRATNELGQVSGVMTTDDGRISRVVAPILESMLILHFTLSSSETLTGDWKLLTRLVPPDRFQGLALADVVEHFNWGRTVATVSTSDIYGSSVLRLFEERGKHYDWTPLATAEFVPGKQDLWREMSELHDSEARVIMAFMGPSDLRTVLRFAERLKMVRSNRYVWMCSEACANADAYLLPVKGSEAYSNRQYQVDWEMRERMVGMLGVRLPEPRGPLYEAFLDQWETLDPLVYPGAGKREINKYTAYAYDATTLITGNTLRLVSNPRPTLQSYRRLLVNYTIEGLTGDVVLDLTASNRMPKYDIINLRMPQNDKDFYEKSSKSHVVRQDKISQLGFNLVGTWDILRSPHGMRVRELYLNDYVKSSNKGKVLDWEKEIQWGGGVDEVPNLDLRNPIKYWSCSEHVMLVDETGRSIRLDPPNGGNGNIADYYRCDDYIDCYNMSDEWGCTVSFPVVFIVYGIVQGLLFLFAVLCLIFTCVFGFCLKRRRVRAASPTFLIIMILACMLGYVGLFSFFGQPQSVACGFRIWIVCLSIVLMIAALFTKSFRIWRLYRSPTEIKAMKDWKLVVLVVILVVPVLILLALWTGLATPKADLREENDKHEHKMCMPGGVAEEAGGYTFFALIVAYIGILLLFGAFLSFVTRNVASTFNESRLIAVSIFNLVFLGIVVIPIYFVLLNSGPVVLWVIIVTAVLYGLSATLFLQFLPKMYGVFIRDRLVDKTGSSFTKTTGTVDTANFGSESGVNSDSKAIW